MRYILFFAFAAAYCICGLFITPIYFSYIQQKPGIMINDPVLDFLPSLDVSFFIFNIMNICAFFSLVWLLTRPKYLAIAVMTWAFVYTFRYSAMYFLTLETPVGFVKLNDPLLDGMVYNGMVISKDLFFSGHTSYMFMTFLVVQHPILKRLSLVSTILVGFLLLVQHNHYTIDVLAAPLFTWLAFECATRLYAKQVV